MSRTEGARLEERCASLAAAQGPLTDLSERLLAQLASRDQGAVAQGHLEAAAKALEARALEAEAENRRLYGALDKARAWGCAWGAHFV